jgi:hypothetical protein
VNTYLSNDGGHNWKELAKESHIYEISDHGGLIVMAKDQKSTNEVLYSWDQGDSWETINIGQSIEIFNIVSDENSISTSFFVFGRDMTG